MGVELAPRKVNVPCGQRQRRYWLCKWRSINGPRWNRGIFPVWNEFRIRKPIWRCGSYGRNSGPLWTFQKVKGAAASQQPLEIDKHIFPDCRTLNIIQKVKRGGIQQYLKTKHGKRYVDLSTPLAAMLRDFIDTRTSGLLFQPSTGAQPSNQTRSKTVSIRFSNP